LRLAGLYDECIVGSRLSDARIACGKDLKIKMLIVKLKIEEGKRVTGVTKLLMISGHVEHDDGGHGGEPPLTRGAQGQKPRNSAPSLSHPPPLHFIMKVLMLDVPYCKAVLGICDIFWCRSADPYL
jgi:hypothetical protein